MQSAARTLPRVARVSRQQVRKFATPAVERPAGYIPTGEEFAAERAAVKAHAVETTDLWRKISLYVCLPGTLIMGLYVKKVEDEHHEHIEHAKHEGAPVGSPDYTWLNRRQKPFPWGNNSLFFNSEANRNLN